MWSTLLVMDRPICIILEHMGSFGHWKEHGRGKHNWSWTDLCDLENTGSFGSWKDAIQSVTVKDGKEHDMEPFIDGATYEDIHGTIRRMPTSSPCSSYFIRYRRYTATRMVLEECVLVRHNDDSDIIL